MAKRGPRASGAQVGVSGPRVLLLGPSGQLGSALFGCYARDGQLERVIPKTREALDVTNHNRVYEVIKSLRPDVVINAAGMTHAAQVRNDGRQAWRTNVAAVSNLAKACALQGAAFIQLSSADVFGSDEQTGPYAEPDAVCGSTARAQNWIAAEHAVMAVPLSGGDSELLRRFKWFVIRVSELFSPMTNYYPSLVYLFHERLSRSRTQFAAPTDVVRSLSFTPIVARHLCWLADNAQKVESGAYHIASPDSGSLYHIAKELSMRMPPQQATLVPTTRDAYATAHGVAGPEIPRNTTLATAKWSSVCPLPLPGWRAVVRAFAAGESISDPEEVE